MTNALRGADIVARTLKAAGVEKVFSLSGNHIMSIYDASIDAGLEILHVRHEAAAVHMADAWARLTGKVGIAMLTGGPGHANGVAALFTARESESPIVLLSGHAPLGQLGHGAFQEMPQADLAAPLAKASWTVESVESLGTDLARAMRIASSGRPGPVHLSLPDDVLEATSSTALIPDAADCAAVPMPVPAAVAGEMAKCLSEAKRPLILLGPLGGTALGTQMLDALTEKTGIPVLVMESPRGINDPSLGAFAEVASQADCILLLGKRPDYTLGFGRPPALSADCQMLQIDPDALALDRLRTNAQHFNRVPRQFRGDAQSGAAALVAAFDKPHGGDAWRSEVADATAYRPAAWREVEGSQAGVMHPAQICLAVADTLKSHPNTILISDGGEFGQWVQACIGNRRRVINGVAGAIGAGLPFALGAKVADPDAVVVMLCGDGSVGFHISEFDTAVRNNLPVVAIVGNDSCWNAEHQIQLRKYGKERAIGCDLLPTAYDQVAVAFGGYGERADNPVALKEALERAIASGKPSCLNAPMDNIPAPLVRRK
ncbi:MAG: thiamine pyrophosphate-binding protein [Thioalkalivibrio sp.]